MNQTLDLTSGPVPKLIVNIALPAAIGYFFNVMFNVVDSWYAGQISTEALAGLSLSFPLYFVFIALSMGFGGGATALIGNALGAGDRDRARHLCRHVLVFAVLLSVLVAVLGVRYAEAVFTWLGASGKYLQSATDYMTALYTFAPIVMLGPLVNAGLAAQGKTQYLRNVLVVGFFANLLLDPWFIYGGFGLSAMGIKGVAYATLVVHAVGLCYLLFKLDKTGLLGPIGSGRITSKIVSFEVKVFQDLLRQGLPAVFGMASTGTFFFIANKYINAFGPEAVAAYGIGLRIEQLVLVSTMAVNHAVLSLVANNLGAGNIERVMHCRRVGLGITAGLLGVGTLLMLLAGGPLMELFSEDREVVAIGIGYLLVEAFTLPAYALIHTNGGVLQGLKRPQAVMWAGLFRAVVMPLILLPVLLSVEGFGISVIWWLVFSLAWATGALLHWHTNRVIRSIENNSKPIDSKLQ